MSLGSLDPLNCPWAVAHDPAPAGEDWSPCIGCGSPQRIVVPMFWPDDVWRLLVERKPGSVTLSGEADPDDPDSVPGEFVVPISGGLYVTLLLKMSDVLKGSGYTLVRDYELDELKEKAGVPRWWEPGRPLP